VRYPVHALWPILNKVTWLVDKEAAKSLWFRWFGVGGKTGRYLIVDRPRTSFLLLLLLLKFTTLQIPSTARQTLGDLFLIS